MRFLLASVSLLIGASYAFQSPSSQRPLARAAMTMTSTASEPVPFAKPGKVVKDVLPNVYVYDHCPFCVRVRFALGLKNVKHLIRFMANDDIATPTALVGKKISPIFEWAEGDICMNESMDIIKIVDADERFGPIDVFLPATGRDDIKAWQKSVQVLLRVLQRPRYVATGLMPEFQQHDGRHAFIMNHQMPPYEKSEWKENMSVEERLSIYAEAMAKDPTDNIEELNRKLVELDDIIFSEYHCSPGGLSYDDIDLFSRLRSITIVKDVIWPKKLRAYMDNMSELGDVPLYDEMAL
jgi:glutaredoxin 2